MLSVGVKIKSWNTKFGSVLLSVIFLSHSLWSAEMTAIPPVAVPSVLVSPPETQGKTTALGNLPPAVALPSTPTPVPIYPDTLPLTSSPQPPGTPLTSQDPLLSTPGGPAPVTAAPILSQPMRAVSPQVIAETEKQIQEDGNYMNFSGEDILEVTKQISRALGKNFILDDKLKGKITIMSERKMTKDEIWEAFNSALDSLGFTIVQGPAGLLRIVPRRDAITHPIDLYSDESPFTDRFITRLITLKNISAADMANVIKGLVSKEGNLFAYPPTNTLILTDSGTNIDRLLHLINELDQEGPQEILEIIPVLYADAKDLAGKMTQIFETDKSGGSAPIKKGKDGGDLEEIPRLKKVIPDDRTNSLIVLASKRSIEKVRDLIRKLDSPMKGDSGEVHVYYLKNASAKDMATVINAISGAVQQNKDKRTPGGDAAKAAVSSLVGGAEFVGKFTVTADESTNALVITAGAKDYNTLLEQVIAKLDIPRRQVYVESVIVELSVSEDQQLGAGLLGGKNFNVNGNNIALFGSTFGFLDPRQLLSGAVGATNTGTNITLSPPGGTATTVPAFFTALQFAQGSTDVNILSTPNILTLDNNEAEIKVGQKVPFPAASATTIGGSLQTTFTREDVTLSLKIKPQINEGGTIRMEVTQSDRNVLPPDQQTTSAATAGPSTTERSIKTAIVATNGQTVVLGGLIKDKYQNVIHKVPILGDIPILGYLFKTKRKTKEKVNLVVFLTPHIIREPKDFLDILQKKINEQNVFVKENFGKSQQKQIRQSLETHASHLLKANEGQAISTIEKPAVKSAEPESQPRNQSVQPSSSSQEEEDTDLAY